MHMRPGVHFVLGVRIEDGRVQVLYTCGQYMGEVRRAVGEAHDFTTGRPITIMTPPLLILLFVFIFFTNFVFATGQSTSSLKSIDFAIFLSSEFVSLTSIREEEIRVGE